MRLGVTTLPTVKRRRRLKEEKKINKWLCPRSHVFRGPAGNVRGCEHLLHQYVKLVGWNWALESKNWMVE